MEFQDVVRRRRMVRRFDPRPVDPGAVDRMLENATHAPSAGFTQASAFLRLDVAAAVERFWAVTNPPSAAWSVAEAGGNDVLVDNAWLAGMRTAPVIIVPVANETAYRTRYSEPDKGSVPPSEQSWPVPYWYVDAGMSALLILQTAVDEGLGACFFGIPAETVVAFRAEFGVPVDYSPVGAIAVGHMSTRQGSRGSPARRKRTAVEELVHRGSW